MTLGRRLSFALVALLLSTPATVVAQVLPIFDAHIHFSRPDWDTYTPERALSILAQAGVRRAIVSSTPDDGTLKLYDRAPAGIVPFLRPYRTRDDMSTWTRDASVATYVEQRLARGIYRGIGEFHMSAADADAPVVRRFAELARERGLFLHAHVDDAAIERMIMLYPSTRILWAHAGMSASADTVGKLLARAPNLWVELALRTDVAPGGTLDPAWRAVFVRYPDRFMVGTDTWVTSRWESLREGMDQIQRWLGQLPRDVAEQIAYRNGERLFPAP
jgi:predicted TIM-barrel fold metal-dependent hydrolase